MITQPMLASQCKDMKKLRFPLLATPKLDGIRCLKIRGDAVSRNFKPIRNPYIREGLRAYCPDGLDGELMVKGAAFNETSGTVMRMNGEGTDQCDFEYWVFDYVADERTETRYAERMRQLADLRLPPFCKKVLPVICHTLEELEAFEEQCVRDGYEGAMVRDPNGPYKCGRSTEREGMLLKIKRFADDEAEVIGFEEKMHNGNPATENAFGRTERKGGQAGLVPAGTLGSLRVRDLKTGVEFNVGSGLNDAQRADIWAHQDSYRGRVVKYRHQPSGKKELPRFPTFLGFRHPDDM